MGLNHTDDCPTGVITPRVTQLLLVIFEFHMECCSPILEQEWPTIVESLHPQGTGLKENLGLQTDAFRLGQSDPYSILVEKCLDKKNEIA